LPFDDPLRQGQDDIDTTLLATGMFQSGASEPPWEQVKSVLRTQGGLWSGLS
jgi:hypothetical protein